MREGLVTRSVYPLKTNLMEDNGRLFRLGHDPLPYVCISCIQILLQSAIK